MNPDDPNQNQNGGQGDMGTSAPSTPVTGGDDQPSPVTEPPQTPTPQQPGMTSEPTSSENCHCGRPTVVGNCSGCNLPSASCTCAPAAV